MVVMITLCLVLGLSAAGWAQSQGDGYPLVAEVIIEGYNRVDRSIIEKAITETKVGEPVSEDKVRSDLQAIANSGYFFDVRANFAEGPEGLAVIFTVVENPVVTKVEVVNDVLPITELRRYMTTRPGRVLNLEELHQDVQILVQNPLRITGYLCGFMMWCSMKPVK